MTTHHRRMTTHHRRASTRHPPPTRRPRPRTRRRLKPPSRRLPRSTPRRAAPAATRWHTRCRPVYPILGPPGLRRPDRRGASAVAPRFRWRAGPGPTRVRPSEAACPLRSPGCTAGPSAVHPRPWPMGLSAGEHSTRGLPELPRTTRAFPEERHSIRGLPEERHSTPGHSTNRSQVRPLGCSLRGRLAGFLPTGFRSVSPARRRCRRRSAHPRFRRQLPLPRHASPACPPRLRGWPTEQSRPGTR